MSLINKPDISKIRQELHSIAHLIGPGKAYSMLLEGDGSIAAMQLPLDVVMGLLPIEHHKFPGAEYSEDTVVTICIQHLFDQLGGGMVSTSLGELVFDIPDFYVADIPTQDLDQAIGIPRSLIMQALWA